MSGTLESESLSGGTVCTFTFLVLTLEAGAAVGSRSGLFAGIAGMPVLEAGFVGVLGTLFVVGDLSAKDGQEGLCLGFLGFFLTAFLGFFALRRGSCSRAWILPRVYVSSFSLSFFRHWVFIMEEREKRRKA